MEYDTEIVSVLEKKFSIQALLAIYENQGCSQLSVLKGIEGNDRTVFLRIKDLAKCNLVRIDEDKRLHNTNLLYTTEKGSVIAAAIAKCVKI